MFLYAEEGLFNFEKLIKNGGDENEFIIFLKLKNIHHFQAIS